MLKAYLKMNFEKPLHCGFLLVVKLMVCYKKNALGIDFSHDIVFMA